MDVHGVGKGYCTNNVWGEATRRTRRSAFSQVFDEGIGTHGESNKEEVGAGRLTAGKDLNDVSEVIGVCRIHESWCGHVDFSRSSCIHAYGDPIIVGTGIHEGSHVSKGRISVDSV